MINRSFLLPRKVWRCISIATKPSIHLRIPTITQFFSQKNIHTSTPLHSAVELSLTDSLQEMQCLKVNAPSRSIEVSALWLRDHCRSPTRYNHQTQQKIPDPDLLSTDLTIQSVSLVQDHSVIKIAWKDGHSSEFDINWLLGNFYHDVAQCRTPRVLWDKAMIESASLLSISVSHDLHMNTEEGLVKTLTNLVKYGFALVDGVEASHDAIKVVVERVSPVLNTLFGEMWSFTADASRSDTAYSNGYLGPHTDTTYLDTPVGIQVFQCHHHSGDGGETLLVDGFRCLDKLRQTHPADFDLLSRTVVPHEYLEVASPNSPGHHLYSLASVVKVHPTSGEILHIRFNPYDRAPLTTVPNSELQAYYKAYSLLTSIVEHPSGHLWVKLKPGQVLFIDNWRVMHGRAAFTGSRVMAGCYLDRDLWVSKARVKGVC